MDIYKFDNFHIHSLDEKSVFLHVDLSDNQAFYVGLFNYFFDETRLLKYAENKTNLTFSPTKKNYVTMYKHLAHYIDDYNQEKLPKDIETELLEILSDEYHVYDDGNGNFNVRLDKMGKIGEYIFCNLLAEYYGFDCIIPKVHLTTDYNMSVYGIDALFYSQKNNMILFGESKLSKSLVNGVGLLNKSLKTYEQQIKDEFMLMLSNRFLKNSMGIFGDLYADEIELSLSVSEFVSNAKVKSIGIPLFIAHGSEVTLDTILEKLTSKKT